jgi:hypothetical protein
MSSPEPPDSSDETMPAARHRRRRSPARPRFLARFPEHPELSRAASAYERGNYAEVRVLCRQLLAREEDAEVRESATELLRRIEPDRLIVAILWGSFILLGLIILWAYGHGR